MDGLNPTQVSTLQAAGWAADRRMDVSSWEADLAAEGMELSPDLRSFLEEFGGLRWSNPSTAGEDYVLIDPKVALGRVWKEELSEWAAELGRASLVPIGVALSQHVTLLATERDEVIGLYDHLIVIGRTYEEAVRNLLTDRRHVEWPSLDEIKQGTEDS